MYMNDGNKTKINLRNKSVFITGVAGFIGSSLAKRLLSTVEGVKVVGLDNMNHYYDVRLKEARLNELEQFDNFSFVKGNLADKAVIESIFEQYKPEIVVNLGAQAGVRYSITNPDAYVEANLIGFYNILEACRHSYDEGHTPVEHLVYASSSSVYGSNKKVPYSTDDKVDNPVSLYAATKKSNELMAHVINNKPNGTNINNNAGSTHIEGLQKFVVEKGLDVGFAFDGDADRCLCVDEKGNVITGDHILYIYGCYMKERGKLLTNTVVTTVMSNFGLYKAFDEQGIGYAKTAVGDKYVYEYMAKNGCRIGGEQSGHIIFSKYASTSKHSCTCPGRASAPSALVMSSSRGHWMPF